MDADIDNVLERLRSRGHRMTPQRRAIVEEIMKTAGHIAPGDVVHRVRQSLPGTNPSTVYRTLDLLEELGVVSHAHFEDGAEYHHFDDRSHLHLVCSRCGRSQSLDAAEAAPLVRLIEDHSGFSPDFTHFAIAGLCSRCKRSASR